MAAATEVQFPKLRPIDVHPIARGGQVYLLLRDPLQLTDKAVTIPQQWAPVLALCDGTRDSHALSAALGIRFGLRVQPGVLEQLLAAFDEALLLEGERFAHVRARALAEYRQAPYRPMALAGRSYPADADELRRLLDNYLAAVDDAPAVLGHVRGLVSPHIDYQRGGQTYARVWKGAREAVRQADLAVLLGTDHLGSSSLLTLTRQSYSTPFGVLPTAREVVDGLAQALGPEAAFGGELHHRSEHSIELAAVWLHYVRDGQSCELVPILCSSFDRFVQGQARPEHDPDINVLVETLGQALVGRRAIVVAAADLSHVGPAFGGRPVDMMGRAQLQAADEELIERICAGDAQGFFAAIKREEDRRNVCGLPPIYLTMRLLNPIQGEHVAYERCPADQNGTSWVSVCGVLFGET
ncbi:MAG: AmmeMemoRadiSam system protein B [Chloroflexi bacterium]|nr:MAG: AmmeMemoRadiSam system protein B [Chloroflexota bacterium]